MGGYAHPIDRHSVPPLLVNDFAKDMKNVCTGFDALENSANDLRLYLFAKFHMIFDIEMEDFHSRAWIVAGGHMINVSS